MTDANREAGPLAPAEIDADSPFTLPGFFSALADGRLVGARCRDCNRRMLPPRPACYDCGSRSVAAETQPREGEILACTAVHRPPSAFEALAPFTVAVVELESGARLTGRVLATYEDVGIGTTVRAVARDPAQDGIDPAAALPYEADWPVHAFEPLGD